MYAVEEGWVERASRSCRRSESRKENAAARYIQYLTIPQSSAANAHGGICDKAAPAAAHRPHHSREERPTSAPLRARAPRIGALARTVVLPCGATVRSGAPKWRKNEEGAKCVGSARRGIGIGRTSAVAARATPDTALRRGAAMLTVSIQRVRGAAEERLRWCKAWQLRSRRALVCATDVSLSLDLCFVVVRRSAFIPPRPCWWARGPSGFRGSARQGILAWGESERGRAARTPRCDWRPALGLRSSRGGQRLRRRSERRRDGERKAEKQKSRDRCENLRV